MEEVIEVAVDCIEDCIGSSTADSMGSCIAVIAAENNVE